MASAVLVRLRPLGPWRFGPGSGGQEGVDSLYRSDRLFSALTLAMQKLGHLEPWLDATARATNPAVSVTSCFPFQGDTLFIAPPATLWPPPSFAVTAPSPGFLSKIRWKAADFVPVALIETMLTGGRILADQWIPDGESRCLLRRDRPSSSPFRSVLKRQTAVDRVTKSNVQLTASASVVFDPGAGLWTAISFRDSESSDTWNSIVKAAFRLLADSGFGGKRSYGWGQTAPPEFSDGTWPGVIFPKLGRKEADRPGTEAESLFWLLSLYLPAAADDINWKTGAYRLTIRGGRVDSRQGAGLEKKQVRMVEEGSVIAARKPPEGSAVDVAPDAFPHPVYRSGHAVVLRLPALHISREAESEVALDVPETLHEGQIGEKNAEPAEVSAPSLEEPVIEKSAAQPPDEKSDTEDSTPPGTLEDQEEGSGI